MIEKNNEKEISLFSVICVVVPMVFAAYPILFTITNIIGIIHGTSYGVNTFMTQKFFDAVASVAGGSKVLSYAILVGLALGLALVANQILQGIHNFMNNILSNKLKGTLEQKINDKSGRLDPLAFENPLFLDDINKAKEGMENSTLVVINIIMLFTSYLPYFVFMGIYLYKLKPSLAFSLVLIFTPVFITQFIRVKIFGELADESAPIRREYEYYERCIVDREYYKETRILGAFAYFKDLYILSIKILNKKIWKAEKRATLIEIAMKIITIFGYVAVLILLVRALIEGDITVGAFGAVFASIESMFWLMEEIVCGHIGYITKSLGTIRNFIRFLKLPERHGDDIVIEGTPTIELKDVSFAYPGAEKESLSNIDFEIKSGESIAIVGENGAGKSTLVKTIIGLYTPTYGKVLINNIDVATVSTKSLYQGISAVFQKYQRYKMTLEENVSISKIDTSNMDKSKAKYKIDNKTNLQLAITKADIDVCSEKFPQGYETMLSREFDGVDLSGGQWQRVAIARGFFKAHNMIVLDEPTATIDPIEETKVYEKFKEMSKGKTSIIVTHRLGSAKIADRIAVMDKGQIIQVGTHEELINAKGKYSEMYESQSKWYKDDEFIV